MRAWLVAVTAVLCGHAAPAQDAAHRADARRTAALNRQALARHAAPVRDWEADRDYQQRLADYATAMAEHDAAVAESDAAQANYRRRLRAYSNEMARWRADVADRPGVDD